MARKKARTRASRQEPRIRPVGGDGRRPEWLLPLLVTVGLGALGFAAWLVVRTPVETSAPPPRSSEPGPAAPRPIPLVESLSQAPRAVREMLAERRVAVERNPQSAPAWGRYAMALDAFELYPQALSCYEAVISLQPDLFEPTYMRAVMLDFTGAPADELVRAFDRAVSLQPAYAPAHLRRGMALARHGELTEAVASFERALALDEDFTWAHRGLGQALLALGRLEEAVEHLETAERLSPGDGTAPAALASAYQQLGRAEEAEQAQARARALPREKSIPDPIRYEVEQTARLASSAR